MIKNIQALRGIAALMVVCVHLGGLLHSLNLPAFGDGGVELFFVISGFVMVHTTRKRPPSSSQFIRNRIARIVPIYWVMTLAVFATALFAHSLVKATTTDSLDLIKSLFFIPFYKSSGLIRPVLFVGWTLNYEMFFYLLFAFGLMARSYILGINCVFGALLLLVLAGILFHSDNVFFVFYTDLKMLDFALGMVIGLFISRAPETAGLRMKCLALSSLICFPVLLAAPLVWPHVTHFITAGLPAAVLVTGALLLERWSWSLKAPLVLAVGDASYALYLSHPWVTQIFEKLGARFHATGLVSIGLIFLTFCTVIVLAYAIHKTIEAPLSRFARKCLVTKKLAPSPV
jgi:peptidoglycan/LPS O-acetylase OafA/YrhL